MKPTILWLEFEDEHQSYAHTDEPENKELQYTKVVDYGGYAIALEALKEIQFVLSKKDCEFPEANLDREVYLIKHALNTLGELYPKQDNDANRD